MKKRISASLLPLFALALLPALPAEGMAHRKPADSRGPSTTPWPRASSQNDLPPQRREFTVFTSRYPTALRILSTLGSRGKAPNVVFLQNAFQADTETLRRETGYPFAARGTSGTSGSADTGLVILSEHPIVAESHRAFSECGTADCESRGGIVHARIELPGVPQPLELYNTQLNAKAPEIRLFQVQEIREFLWDTQASHLPAVFAGDFRLKPTEDAYLFFKAFSNMTDTFRQCALTLACGNPRAIPRTHSRETARIFYLDGTSPEVSLNPLRLETGSGDSVKASYELTW